MNANQPIVALQDVSKTYPSAPEPLPVLRDVNFEVNAGECAAIIGPSGCGKSTLLNLMGTLDAPTSGKVLFKGRDVTGLSSRELARLRNREIGFVFQLHHLLPQCTVLENVLVPSLVNKEAGDAYGRAETLLEQVGLGERLHQRPGQLSGGECQRVAVARALINRPSLLLADEPTGSLNQEGAEHLADMIIELNHDEKMAVVLVTHSVAIAERFGRVFELRGGQLTAR